MLNYFNNRKKPSNRAEAMVEFALVAPILFLMLLGIIEVGRMLFLYASVVNASREAVRYGSAVGYDETGVIKYKNCSAMAALARQVAYTPNAIVEIIMILARVPVQHNVRPLSIVVFESLVTG